MYRYYLSSIHSVHVFALFSFALFFLYISSDHFNILFHCCVCDYNEMRKSNESQAGEMVLLSRSQSLSLHILIYGHAQGQRAIHYTSSYKLTIVPGIVHTNGTTRRKKLPTSTLFFDVCRVRVRLFIGEQKAKHRH